MTAIENPVSAENTAVPTWKKLELPGLPVLRGANGEEARPSTVLRDAAGNAVLCSFLPWFAVQVLNKRFDNKIEVVYFVTDEQEYRRFRSSGIPGEVTFTYPKCGFAYTGNEPLSIPERAEASAIIWMHEQYVFSTPRAVNYQYPDAMKALSKHVPDGRVTLPFETFNEEKAYQFASIVGTILQHPTDVVAHDGGFYVTISGDIVRDYSDEFVAMSYYGELLEKFHVIPDIDSDDGLSHNVSSEDDFSSLHHVSEHTTQQARIESKLDQLLTLATQTPSPATKTPTATVKPSTTAVDIFGTPKTHVDTRRGNKNAKPKK